MSETILWALAVIFFTGLIVHELSTGRASIRSYVCHRRKQPALYWLVVTLNALFAAGSLMAMLAAAGQSS